MSLCRLANVDALCLRSHLMRSFKGLRYKTSGFSKQTNQSYRSSLKQQVIPGYQTRFKSSEHHKLPRMTVAWNPRDHIPAEVKELLSEPSPNYVLAFLHIVEQLKLQRRTGWVDHDVAPCESIADHMYRMSTAAMLIKDPKVDVKRCVRIAIVHDIAESLVGDITPFDPITKEEKHQRELDTIKYLCEEIIKPYNPEAAENIMNDWLAYENIDCLEARYVKDIDKFEMLLQCYEYERRQSSKQDLSQFYSSFSSIKTEEVKAWAADLLKRRNEFMRQNNQPQVDY